MHVCKRGGRQAADAQHASQLVAVRGEFSGDCPSAGLGEDPVPRAAAPTELLSKHALVCVRKLGMPCAEGWPSQVLDAQELGQHRPLLCGHRPARLKLSEERRTSALDRLEHFLDVVRERTVGTAPPIEAPSHADLPGRQYVLQASSATCVDKPISIGESRDVTVRRDVAVLRSAHFRDVRRRRRRRDVLRTSKRKPGRATGQRSPDDRRYGTARTAHGTPAESASEGA